MTYFFSIALVLSSLCVVTFWAQSVEPIWLSPTIVGANFFEQYPPRGVWSNISIGAGSRFGTPWVFMDSKKILWILYGRIAGEISVNAIWNYDPKTDLYRWVAGFPDTNLHNRVFGELRVPAANNWPSLGVSDLTSTMDHKDNIWFIPNNSGEVWMFNTTSLWFASMKGQRETESSQSPRYGTPGQPSEEVWPGKTSSGCLSVDSFNNLWLMGGSVDVTSTNRVWHFNTTSYLWTFVAGNMTSNQVSTVYGDNPQYGSRTGQSCDIDDSDRIWLFGGGVDSLSSVNDVWSFDTRAAQWRLEFAATSTNGIPNATIAVPNDFDPNNHPSGAIWATFSHRKDDTLLRVSGRTNDMWLFHKTLKQWKLIYGDPFNEDYLGNYSNYRARGSSMPTRFAHGASIGINTDGNVFVVGGRNNDIWLIPQTNCTSSPSNKCSPNAQCSRDMFVNTCQCNDGFTGDGITCVGPPVIPIADVPVAEPVTPSDMPIVPSTSPVDNPVAVPVVDVAPSASPIIDESRPLSSSPQSKTRLSGAVTIKSALFGITVLALL